MKKILIFALLLVTHITLHAQQISDVQTRFTGSNIEVTYTLNTDKPRTMELLYSVDNGKTYQSCHSVEGDLYNQTSGVKKIIWDCVEDGVLVANVMLKVGFYKDIEIEIVYVEGGTFMMGCPDGFECNDWEKPVHKVTLNSFRIGKYEVTQKQWKAVMDNNPSLAAVGDNYPVENVSWNDAQEFIHRLNVKTGKNYRLPTGAEWEYAARGGNKSRGYKYSGSNNVDEVAWNAGNSRGRSQPVGTKKPNELGIYDMSGNVWEWCNDWYGAFSATAQINPSGASSGTLRVIRGGDWFDSPMYCRTTLRAGSGQNYSSAAHGFRLVLP